MSRGPCCSSGAEQDKGGAGIRGELPPPPPSLDWLEQRGIKQARKQPPDSRTAARLSFSLAGSVRSGRVEWVER